MNLDTHFKKFDWVMFFSALFLSLIGLLSLYSSSFFREDNFSIFKKQILFLAIGILTMFILSFIDWRVFKENSYLILFLYFICLFLLLGLYFFAPKIRGIRSWYRIGGFSFSPIEITKIVLLILLSKYFSTRHIEMYKLQHIIFSGIYVFLPSLLIFFQPDLGSVIILFCLWVGILIISGIKLKHFFILILLGLVIFSFSWLFLLKDYQRARIIGFFVPKEADYLGIKWSQEQAKIAIGSGGIFGQGIKKGSQTQYGFLPESHTDFIFAAIAEEFGLVGVFFVFILFAILLWRIIKISLSSQTNFCRLFSAGFAFILFSQILINIGMNLSLLPVVGISLPLISYGGSNLIAVFVGLGILESMRIH